ncbi:hybrid sensor histidine kinase/response regulator [Leptolyngbya sp. NIES-2104]|uniref:hybrid sensor histidine kinase/response regulator n=1 Tax=Leptolyngbya sp. NIES-2104 TaxID=1552121 RepID=UPI0006EC51E0|nr:hybrid sensor histidine kinase/response regulator [Leptolyngbya sp. NIES-2104]GAP98222.1 signal transduction histidine kinase CheA [Leptolyngbya sp. NIES-2104]
MSNEKELEIRRQFLDEAQEYIASLETAIVELSQGLNSPTINAALRVAHSLKGGAAMMGFKLLSELAHQLEDALKVLKMRESIAIDSETNHLLLLCVNCLYQIIGFERYGEPINPTWISKEVEPTFAELRSRLGEPQAETAASVLSIDNHQDLVPLLFETEVEESLQRLEELLATSNQSGLKAEAILLAQELGGLGEMLQLQDFTQLCDSIEQSLLTSPQHLIADVTRTALKTWRRTQALILTGQLDQVPTEIDPIGVTQTVSAQVVQTITATDEITEDSNTTVRVSVRQLNRIQDLFGELTIDRNGLDLNLRRIRGLTRQLAQRLQILQQVNYKLRTIYDRVATPQPAMSGRSITSVLSSSSEFDILEMDRYTDLHSLSQQVIETIVQLQEVTDDLGISLDDTDQSARNVNKTSKQLQSGFTRLRMRPFAELVDRFPRALQEWCSDYGKSVRLHIEGEAVLLDRNILETLQDPLLHLLRNAFDHGIEDFQTRMERGKPAEGLIELRAMQQGNRTVITIQDDGAGIAIDKIRDRAAEIGLDPALLASASEAELLSLIFEPGFSTSDRVSDLSGRGVGMDVVRTHLQQIRGEITINTQVGVGTTFTLSVPATLSTVRVVLAESNGVLLAIPSEAIAEVILFKPENVIPTGVGEAIDYQGQPVSLIRLQHKLHFNCIRTRHSYETPPMLESDSVILIRQGLQLTALQVDRCWTDQEVTARSMSSFLPLPTGYNGCTILGDGRVVPLVNVPEFLHEVTSPPRVQPSLPALLSAATSVSLPTIPSILVVDDSINVRRFLALTLSKSGYQVEQAKDGQDAIEQLEAGLAVQAIVCDIEMPRLDGFGLLTKLKANRKLNHIPVTMLTSRSGDKHRQLATQLGAEAYFPKPYNEQALLQTLERLIA